MKARGKRLLFGVGILAIAAVGVGALFFFRSQKDAVVHTSLPKGVAFIPRSAFGAKPKIDIPWFGGERLQYPRKGKMPKDFKDLPYIAGILTWEDPPKTASTPSFFEMSLLGPYVFNFSDWRDEEGQNHEVFLSQDQLDTGAKRYAILPAVYGKRKVRMQATWVNAFELRIGVDEMPPTRKMSIDLPPLGKSAPVLKTETVQLGKWTLTLKPRPLLSPEFLPVYDCTLGGEPKGQQFLLEIAGHHVLSAGMQHGGFLVKSGVPFRLIMHWPNKAKVVVRKVEEVQFELIARKSKTGTTHVFDLYDAKGKVFTEATSDSRFTHVAPSLDGAFFNLEVGPHVVMPIYGKPQSLLEAIEFTTRVRAPKTPITAGQKLLASAYKQTEKAVGTLVLTGPADQAGFRPLPKREVPVPTSPAKKP